MKISKFFLIIPLFLFLIVFFIEINFMFLTDKKFSFKNFNFQGIECIDNEVYLVSNFDSKIYKLNTKFQLEEFLDTKLIYKKKFIFSHITSFYIKNNKFHGINSMDKLNGIIVKAILNLKKNNNKLSNLDYEIVNLNTNINHFEYISGRREILVSHFHSSKSKKNILRIEIDGKLKCEIKNELAIENMYYDTKTEKLFLISNFFKHYMGIIHKISFDNLCKNKEVNFFSTEDKKLIFFPFSEFEGYTVCKNKEYFVYLNKNDSSIYIK